MTQTISKMINDLPEEFSLIKIKEKIQGKSGDNPSPYEIVCLQECEKLNQLLKDIQMSLEELFLGMEGALNMTERMEQLQIFISLNRVPLKWG